MHIQSLIHPKPEYLFRPSQIGRRIVREFAQPNEYEEVMLPWGLPIRIRPRDSIGSCIWRLGMFELSVSEAIYRLADPGELAIDVGAHIGHMTSLMAIRVGSTGRVLSFEPHPLTFDELSANVNRWAAIPGTGSIRAHRMALSDTARGGVLGELGEGSVSRAGASLGLTDEPLGLKHEVDLRPLSEFVAEKERVGILKVDVEGHEYRVLKGAENVLHKKGIRDIIFEELRPYPTEATAFVEEAGYKLFSVGQNFWGLTLNLPNVVQRTRSDHSPTYLGTSDPDRAARRLQKRGWTVLRPMSQQPSPS